MDRPPGAGRQRANVLTAVGRGVDAEQLMAELVPRAERAYGANSSRMAAMHAGIEFAQRRRGRLRAAADSAQRSVDIYAITLPGSIYEAYSLKAGGDDLRGIGETDAAISRFGRALAIFRRIDDAVSRDNVLWC